MWILNLRLIVLLTLLLSLEGHTQIAWTWTPLADMPVKTSNNAVSQGEMSGDTYVYSFGGIDTTKIWSGINKRAFRYDVTNDIWDEIDTLPVIQTLIASSANTVKNKIYIMGGYHVYSGGNEVSSDEVIIYDPETNTYLPNGTPIPVPIDDQVQCVWNDSLIYVITGWSNTGNVPDVQIYDPALDQWQVGLSVPNVSQFKVFGSSGQIVNDTIYYYGGAVDIGNFSSQRVLRKGIINPANPAQINWILLNDAPNDNYRSACLTHGNNVFWAGGSATSYNYNGIAYNGTGGVEPSMNIARYDGFNNDWHEGAGASYGKMDMRGNGQISATEWIICGGMEAGQAVTNTTFKLSYDPITGSIPSYAVPEYQIVNRELIFQSEVQDLKLIGLDGKLVSEIHDLKIGEEFSGVYILVFSQDGLIYRDKIFLQ